MHFDYRFLKFTFDLERQVYAISSLFIQRYFISDEADYFLVFIINKAKLSETGLNYLTSEVADVLIRICSFFSTRALYLRSTPRNCFEAGLHCLKGECCTLLVSTSKAPLQTSFLGFEPIPLQMITTRILCVSLRKCCTSGFTVSSIVMRSPIIGNPSDRFRYTHSCLQKISFLSLSICPMFSPARFSIPDFR